ncbi:MAG: class I SAM-dependent methyltransferase [Gammaproteobacteria bacterium]
MSIPANHIMEWESTYSADSSRHKNYWPSEFVVSYVKRNISIVLSEQRGGSIRVLDIGCGWGNNLRFLLREKFDAYGIDYTESAISALKEEFGDRVQVADARKIPFADDTFDLVIDRSSIQHNPKEHLSEIYREVIRVLKRDTGRFFSISVKDGDNGYLLTRLTRSEIDTYLSGFVLIEVNTQTITRDHGKQSHSNWIVDASLGLNKPRV